MLDVLKSKYVFDDENSNKEILNEFYEQSYIFLEKHQFLWEKEKAKKIGHLYEAVIAIIERKDKAEIQFYHRTFQEFFAAKYLILLFTEKRIDELESIFHSMVSNDQVFSIENRIKSLMRRMFIDEIFSFINGYDEKVGKEISKIFQNIHKFTKSYLNLSRYQDFGKISF